jgi:hypothetical protein
MNYFNSLSRAAKPLKRLLTATPRALHRAEATVLMRDVVVACEMLGLALVLLCLPGFAQQADTNSVPVSTNSLAAAQATAETNQPVVWTNVIRGRVVQVSFRPSITFLNLDKPYPDMTVSGVIFANRTNLFGDLASLRGRTVLLKGTLTYYNGRPQIVLDDTNQIEVLEGEPEPAVASSPAVTEPEKQGIAATSPGAQAESVSGTPRAPRAAAPAPALEPGLSMAPWFIAGALTVIAALLAWLVFTFRRSGLGAPRTPGTSIAVALPPANTPQQIGPGVVSDQALKALTAGNLTDPEAQALREKVASELTEYAKQRLVQGLYSQRKELAETQQKAQQQLAELEARLTALHLPQKERITAYEQRIAELERDLETRDDEMRELVRATLSLVRERLETAKEEDTGRFTVTD